MAVEGLSVSGEVGSDWGEEGGRRFRVLGLIFNHVL